ncbi:hypothetical protein KR026_007781 [Drosophila bipectinata]|nr:hypothetical protein KR026_007781 [Drosophila bipectinata]
MWLEVEPPNMLGSLDVNSSTGFSFDNCVRNRDLVKEGIEGPNVVSTGTTIVGLTYRDGVMIASDSRSTSGSIITFKTTRKIRKIQDHIYAGGAGMAADISALLDLTHAQMNLHRMNTGDRLVPVRCANQFLKHVLYRFRGVLGASFIIGGVDKEGAHLFCTRFDGTTDILPYATIGSGGMAAMGVLETRYKCRMSESSARRLIKEAVHCGMENDLYSGNESHICTIRKDYSVSFEVDSTEDDCVDRDIANIRIKPGSTRVLKTIVHWVADMYDNIVYTLPRDCDSWYPVPRHKQGEVEIWRNGRGPTRLFVPFGETRPATGARPGQGASQGAPNPRAVRKVRSGTRPGAVPRKLPAGGATNKRDKCSRTPECRRSTKNTNRKAGGKRSPSRRDGGRSRGHKKRTSRRKDAEQGLQNEGREDGEDTERSSEGTEVESLEESSGVEDNRVLGDSEDSFKSLRSSDHSEMDLGPEGSAEKKSGSEEFEYSDMEEWDGPTDVGQEPVDGFDRNTQKQEWVERRRQRRRQIMRLMGCRTGAGAAPGGDGGDDPGRGGRGNGNGRGGGSGRRDDDDEEKKNAEKKKAKEKRKKKKKERREARERLKREAEERKRKEDEEEQKKAEQNKKRAEEKKSEDKPQDKPQDKPNEEKKDEDKSEADEKEENAESSLLISPSRPLKRRHSSDADDEDSDDDEKPQPAKRARF